MVVMQLSDTLYHHPPLCELFHTLGL